MKIGIAMFPTVDAPAPGRLGRMIEDRGLESLWFAAHLPVADRSGGGGDGGIRTAETFDAARGDDRGAAAGATALKSRPGCVWCRDQRDRPSHDSSTTPRPTDTARLSERGGDAAFVADPHHEAGTAGHQAGCVSRTSWWISQRISSRRQITAGSDSAIASTLRGIR